uniref:Uncharacterized protein n=1 Tax=Aegilops tauschii subsp. strangulata TaxID=200361 RepID=A0A453LDC7_AEGTS
MVVDVLASSPHHDNGQSCSPIAYYTIKYSMVYRALRKLYFGSCHV